VLAPGGGKAAVFREAFAEAMATAPPSALGGHTPIPIILTHAEHRFPCLAKPCGAGLGSDHAALSALLDSGDVTPFGTW
jgi:hypothetical protein